MGSETRSARGKPIEEPGVQASVRVFWAWFRRICSTASGRMSDSVFGKSRRIFKKYLCCVPISMPGHVKLYRLVDRAAIEPLHLGDRGDLVHPHAGEVGLPIGRMRGRCRHIGFAVAHARHTGFAIIQPLRVPCARCKSK